MHLCNTVYQKHSNVHMLSRISPPRFALWCPQDVPESLPSHSTESWIRGKSFRSLRLEGGRLTMHTTDKRADDNLEAILTFSYG